MNGVELGLTRARALLHGPKAPPLAQHLNLWALGEDALVGVNLDFSTIYELEPESVFLMDPARADLYTTQLRAMLNSLPQDCVIQLLVQIRKGDAETVDAFKRQVLSGPQDRLSRLVIDKKCEFIAGKFTQRRRVFLFATSRHAGGKQPPVWLLPVFRRPLRGAAPGIHAERAREHALLEQVVAERLHSMGVRHRKLSRQETLDLIHRHLNPRRPGGLKDASLSPFRTLREQVLFSPLEESFDNVRINDTYFRGLSLLKLPEAAHLGYTQRLLNALWPDCDLCLTIHSLDSEAAISSLKLRNNITRTLAFSTMSKNYEAEQKHLELDELITEVRGSAQRLFKFSLSVLVRADSAEELRDKTNPVLSAFRDFASAEAISDDMNHFRLFLQSIPGHAPLNDRQFYIQTDALAGFLPLTGTWRGSKDQKMLLETPLGELVGLDPFDGDLPAKHGLILGTTGSGKSFTTNYILNNFLIESGDNHVIIIDVGGSYRKITRAFDGAYLEVSLSEQFGFNPFPRRDAIMPGDQWDDDAVAYLSLLVSRMCAAPGQVVSTYDKGFLERAIKAAYAKKEEVLLSDVRKELYALAKEYPGAKLFADSLELWTSGMYGRLFNRPGQLDISKRMVVFDLQNLENHPDLQSVYFFVIRSIIWGKLLNRSLKKIIVVDEGWKFFNDEVGSELIQNLYRTARKFNGAVFSISQSPKDFLDTKAAPAIIANSYIKYVLKLTKGHDLLNQFELNANEVEAVKLLQSKPGVFSDVFVKYGGRSLVARIEPCPLDYWICTTDAKDFVLEDKVRAENPGLSEADLLLKLTEIKR